MGMATAARGLTPGQVYSRRIADRSAGLHLAHAWQPPTVARQHVAGSPRRPCLSGPNTPAVATATGQERFDGGAVHGAPRLVWKSEPQRAGGRDGEGNLALSGDDCHAAMCRARDCERKWLRRKTEAGRFKRRLKYQAARLKRRQERVASGDIAPGQSALRPDAKPGHPLGPVLFSRRDGDGALDSRAPTEVIAHDPQATPDSRPRPPPAS
jgi:hypothetical protein